MDVVRLGKNSTRTLHSGGNVSGVPWQDALSISNRVLRPAVSPMYASKRHSHGQNISDFIQAFEPDE